MTGRIPHLPSMVAVTSKYHIGVPVLGAYVFAVFFSVEASWRNMDFTVTELLVGAAVHND